MDSNLILLELPIKTEGALYFSESERPLVIEHWGELEYEEVLNKIIETTGAIHEQLKKIDTKFFFDKIIRTADPSDEVVIANAKKFQQLHQFLDDFCHDTTIIRVEQGTEVPIYITSYLPDNTIVVIKTTAIES